MEYRRNFTEKESQCIKDGYECLSPKLESWENFWGNGSPEIFKNCKHKRFDIQANNRGSKNIRGCDVCKYYSYYDCSD